MSVSLGASLCAMLRPCAKRAAPAERAAPAAHPPKPRPSLGSYLTAVLRPRKDSSDVEDGDCETHIKSGGAYGSATIADQLKLGESVWNFQNGPNGAQNNMMQLFVHKHFPSMATKETRKCKARCKRALKLYLKSDGHGSAQCRRGKGRQSVGVRTCEVAPARRKRQRGAGRPILAPEIGEELWHWFVDTVRNLRCRIDSNMLIDQATIIMSDIERYNDEVICDGRPEDVAQLPKSINAVWIFRWRKQYGVTFRTRNICYKVSNLKLNMRLGVFWRNIIRFRILCEALLGYEPKVMSGDQKPFYFNNNGSTQLLAVRGTSRVECIEDHGATRERYTGMSLSSSWVDEDQIKFGGPKLAVLFKGVGAKVLEPNHPGVKVQWAEKGSYRVEHVLEWLAWVLPPVEKYGAVLVLLDWYACHICAEVLKFVRDCGHYLILIPGGSTPWIAVCDTHLHHALSLIVKQMERADAVSQRRLRPHKLPCRDKPTVLRKTIEGWFSLDHTRSQKGHIANGITSALDGSEDYLLTGILKYYWVRNDIDGFRAQAHEEILAGVKSGELSSMDDFYTKLLEPYDNHPPMREGEEGAYVVTEDTLAHEDGSPPGSDVEFDFAPHAAVMEAAAAKGAAVMPDVDFECAPAPGTPPDAEPGLGAGEGAASGSAAAAPSAATTEKVLASGDISVDAIRASIKLNADAGNTAICNVLENELHRVLKKVKLSSTSVAKTVKFEATQRNLKLRVDQQTAKLEDKWDSKFKKVLELKKADGLAALARAKGDLVALRVQELALKSVKARERFLKYEAKLSNERFARYYATSLNRSLAELPTDRSKALIARVRVLVDAGTPPILIDHIQYWEPAPAYSINVSTQPGWSKKNPTFYASRMFSSILYEGMLPEDCDAASAGAGTKFNHLVRMRLPAFNMLSAGKGATVAHAILKDFKYNCDLAFVGCVHLYSRTLGVAAFPEGLHHWPPADTWPLAVPEIKFECADATIELTAEMDEGGGLAALAAPAGYVPGVATSSTA